MIVARYGMSYARACALFALTASFFALAVSCLFADYPGAASAASTPSHTDSILGVPIPASARVHTGATSKTPASATTTPTSTTPTSTTPTPTTPTTAAPTSGAQPGTVAPTGTPTPTP